MVHRTWRNTLHMVTNLFKRTKLRNSLKKDRVGWQGVGVSHTFPRHALPPLNNPFSSSPDPVLWGWGGGLARFHYTCSSFVFHFSYRLSPLPTGQGVRTEISWPLTKTPSLWKPALSYSAASRDWPRATGEHRFHVLKKAPSVQETTFVTLGKFQGF
jgi:hypothetical protein